MTRTYECMFLIDNDSVRASWSAAKDEVSGLLEKHGGKVLTARHWDERRLAYPVRHRNRATYLFSYCELEQKTMPELRRDLDISETVLRYLILSADSVPEKELELSKAEQDSGFVLPEPPSDDEPEPAPEPPPEAPRSRREPAEKPEAEKAEAKEEEVKEKPAEADSQAEEKKADQETPEPVQVSDGDKEGS